MKERFEKQLQSDFPFMQQNRDKKERNIYRKWGCECSSGWFELIYELCQRITNRYAEEGIPANEIDLEILQIKEKFGTLRFYYKFKGVSGELQAIDFLGVASFRIVRITKQRRNSGMIYQNSFEDMKKGLHISVNTAVREVCSEWICHGKKRFVMIVITHT